MIVVDNGEQQNCQGEQKINGRASTLDWPLHHLCPFKIIPHTESELEQEAGTYS